MPILFCTISTNFHTLSKVIFTRDQFAASIKNLASHASEAMTSAIGPESALTPGGGGGGYSHTLPIRVCAAQRGHDFKAPDLERGIHFRGVF